MSLDMYLSELGKKAKEFQERTVRCIRKVYGDDITIVLLGAGHGLMTH